MKKNLHGFDEVIWDQAKSESQRALVSRARLGKDMTYSELAASIVSINLEAHDPRLFHLLYEISTDEARQGRGMLTAIVVHKTGDKKPGSGFFELAKSLGFETKDRDAFWIGELKKVYGYWANNTLEP
jgi:hypothetical protein